ncbi:MAG: methyltransferase domain-containing protein [Candidatus Aminicenantes bacterium]|nr:methyltransferase domain-containing protein [Candidatus Aminicenantes bacterium]NIM84214.1 methyltransferase domain-containing protein [Candidatus Aminicenantes bacterium]NIN23663.1 methyltransferase domain-containing protein [Candidatus Aminicenantes bacterium]NIN47370.1 methyltransferase domain-containing protein [Candidatus Aminicenantes bacterium]NIN90298.1 methyltransferase domain-containing protein [Candidatus Aminicenantes bacterium]
MKFKELVKFLVWELVSAPLLKLKKKRIYSFEPGFKGLNLGCGFENIPGWIGIEGGVAYVITRKLPKPLVKLIYKKFNMSVKYSFAEYYSKLKSMKIIHHNLLYGIPFADDSVPNIFSSHFVEHLSKEEGEFLLRESYRVLCSQGIIRICIPSLDEVVREMKEAIVDYDSGGIEKIQKFVTAGFGATGRAGYMASFQHYFHHHRRMYNFRELRAVLGKVGFKEIKEREYKKGNIPDVELLDTRPGLFVEAVK